MKMLGAFMLASMLTFFCFMTFFSLLFLGVSELKAFIMVVIAVGFFLIGLALNQRGDEL